LIHAEGEDQAHLDDESDAEEERDAAQALVTAAPFKSRVVKLVDRQPEEEEHRHQQQAG